MPGLERRCLKVRSSNSCQSLIALLLIALLLPGCIGGTTQPTVPDLAPIGAGLRFIGIGIVVMALVFVLGTSRNP